MWEDLEVPVGEDRVVESGTKEERGLRTCVFWEATQAYMWRVDGGTG